ncbi:hypothetical protein D0869_04658 [Hortaea werneckii]|uniref:SH3 domain-containing protein n=1 Tax=Hortaea werneckii TaxID=91943 RepID=A0A3M6X1D3_HORWE|nr:hypothetical protein D0869_04658 [Hortaea werneckii]RMY15988.1 hypothetical protein D0868_00579 [Hortaea werneckii]
MADVLSPEPVPDASSVSPSQHHQPRSSPPSSALPSASRDPSDEPTTIMSSHSGSRNNSRPASISAAPTTHGQLPDFPAFQSSLSYALVRDFAYPYFHPMHYGAPPDLPSEATTPGAFGEGEQWGSGRRLSDPMDAPGSGWTAGPWGEHGGVRSRYGTSEEPEDLGRLDGSGDFENLPRTSFGGGGIDDDLVEGIGGGSGTRRQHSRKSRSYGNMADFERGRRRESAGYRRSRTGQDAASGGVAAGDMFHFSGSSQADVAGRDTLRQSRNYGRRDSHFASMPSSYHHAASRSDPEIHNLEPNGGESYDEDTTIPLDLTAPTSPSHSPQRTSMVPEDEELYAGQSLVLYDFEPENANELGLREGQVIMVSYRHGQGWLVAEDPETGEQGLVPEAYVRLLSDLPHFDVETGRFREEVEEENDEGGGTTELVGRSSQAGRDGKAAVKGDAQDEKGTVVLGEKSAAQEGRVDSGQ